MACLLSVQSQELVNVFVSAHWDKLLLGNVPSNQNLDTRRKCSKLEGWLKVVQAVGKLNWKQFGEKETNQISLKWKWKRLWCVMSGLSALWSGASGAQSVSAVDAEAILSPGLEKECNLQLPIWQERKEPSYLFMLRNLYSCLAEWQFVAEGKSWGLLCVQSCQQSGTERRESRGVKCRNCLEAWKELQVELKVYFNL